MRYFVSNDGQGFCSNAERGANPQLDSARISFRPLLLKLLNGVVTSDTSSAKLVRIQLRGY